MAIQNQRRSLYQTQNSMNLYRHQRNYCHGKHRHWDPMWDSHWLLIQVCPRYNSQQQYIDSSLGRRDKVKQPKIQEIGRVTTSEILRIELPASRTRTNVFWKPWRNWSYWTMINQKVSDQGNKWNLQVFIVIKQNIIWWWELTWFFFLW